eukprot:949737-Heterocapsa_arctica.AAC.1
MCCLCPPQQGSLDPLPEAIGLLVLLLHDDDLVDLGRSFQQEGDPSPVLDGDRANLALDQVDLFLQLPS